MNHPARKLREQRGLTIEEVAAKADVSERSIRRMESYEQVSVGTRKSVAAALEVDFSEIYEPVGIGSIISGVDGPARIAGQFGGNYVLQPLEFGPPIEVSEAELKARYAVDTVAPATRENPRGGYEALAEASHLNANRIARAAAVGEAQQADVDASEAHGWAKFADALDETR